jgi:hypothetical protein
MTYFDYHNLSAYQKAKQLTLKVLAIHAKQPNFNKLEPIFHQLIRSTSSIGANIAEGYGRNNPKEYRQQAHTLISYTDLIELNKEIIRILTVTIRRLSNPPVSSP